MNLPTPLPSTLSFLTQLAEQVRGKVSLASHMMLDMQLAEIQKQQVRLPLTGPHSVEFRKQAKAWKSAGFHHECSCIT
jgi:hypothetical protein